MLRCAKARRGTLLLAMPLLLLAAPGCSETSSPGPVEETPRGIPIPGQLTAEALGASAWGDLFAHTTHGCTPIAADGSFSARFDSSAVRAPLVVALGDGTPILAAQMSLANDTIRVDAAATAGVLLDLDPLLWAVPAGLREATLTGLADQLGAVTQEIATRLAGDDPGYLLDEEDLAIQTALAQLLRGAVTAVGRDDSELPRPAAGTGGESSPVVTNPHTCAYALVLGDYYSDEWISVALVDAADLLGPLQPDTPARTPLALVDGRYRLCLQNGRRGCSGEVTGETPSSADLLARRVNLARGCGTLLQDALGVLPSIAWLEDPGSFSVDSLEDVTPVCQAWDLADSLGLFRAMLDVTVASGAALASDVDGELLTMLGDLARTMALACDGLVQGRFATDLCASADSTLYYVEITGSDLRILDPPETLLPPVNLTAVMGDSCAHLEWQDLANNEEGYVVQRARYGGFSDLAELPADAVSYEDCSVVGGNTYRYQIRAYHQQLRSDPSNNVEIAVPEPPDEFAPGYIWDLSSELVGSNRVLLTWTTPGDDGNTGLASYYDVRYAAEPINDGSWDLATQVIGEPDPLAPGNRQSFRIDSLEYAIHYHFSVKVGDEVPNWSLLSNPTEVTTSAAAIGPELLLVLAGSFTMGSDPGEGGADEEPEHQPYLAAYYVDKYEVTNALFADGLNWALEQGLIEVEPHEQYGNIRKAGGGEYYILLDWNPAGGECRIMREFGYFEPEAGWDNHAVVNVTWHGVAAYSNWRSTREGLTPCYDLTTWECNYAADGYRLPSEAEWEKAARGAADERIYPWSGSGISCSLCNRFGCVGHTVSVDDPFYLTGVSTYGGWHMAGNVTEWCNDWYSTGYYEESPEHDPRGPDFGQQKVVRGGSWLSQELPRCSWRKAYQPGHSWTSIGFRCVRNE